jgi:acetoin utilization protein AcuB
VSVETCEQRMVRKLHTVKPMDSIRHAREIMEMHRVNQLPVVVGSKLVGIVTDRDLRDATPSVFETSHHAPGVPDLDAIRIKDVMTENVLTLSPSASLVEAARLMQRERVGAIPIVDGDRLVGLVARSDVLDAFVAIAEPR